jgi:hypothetical protein
MNAPFSKFGRAVAVGLMLGLGCSLPALAHGGHHFSHFHHHHRVGVFVGFGDPFWPWYGPPYPYPVAVPTEPPTYIEKGGDTATSYYCDQSKAYFPAVTDCPGGWQQVTPSPSPQ